MSRMLDAMSTSNAQLMPIKSYENPTRLEIMTTRTKWPFQQYHRKKAGEATAEDKVVVVVVLVVVVVAVVVVAVVAVVVST